MLTETWGQTGGKGGGGSPKGRLVTAYPGGHRAEMGLSTDMSAALLWTDAPISLATDRRCPCEPVTRGVAGGHDLPFSWGGGGMAARAPPPDPLEPRQKTSPQ